MKNSKLVQILKTLSEKEWTNFEKFAVSPYFNKGRNYLPLIKALRKFYPDFSSPDFTRQYVYNQLYKGRKYNDNTLKSSLTGLLGLAKEFLIQEGFNNDSFEKEIFLLKEYSSRRINTLFESDYKAAIESRNEIQNQMKLVDLRDEYYLLNTLMKEYSKGIIEYRNLKTIDFVCNLMQSPIIYNTLEEQFNVSSPGNVTEVFLKNLNVEKFVGELNNFENKFKEELFFHYFMFKSEIEPSNTDNYAKARDIYYKIFDTLSHRHKFNYFRFLEGYLIIHRRKGNIDAIWGEDQEYELSKNILEKDIYSFSPEEYMAPNTLHNIFSMSLSRKDYEFSAELINRHTFKIQPELRANVKNSLLAYYSFEKKEYNNAMEYLSSIKPLEKDFWQPHYKLHLRKLKLMIFFELSYYENLFSEIDSFRHYLKSSRDSSEEYKAPYLLFVNDVERILKAVLNNTVDEALEVKKRLTKPNTRKDFYNQWLLRKADEILKS